MTDENGQPLTLPPMVYDFADLYGLARRRDELIALDRWARNRRITCFNRSKRVKRPAWAD